MAPVLPLEKGETRGAVLLRACEVEHVGAPVVQQARDLYSVRDPAPAYDRAYLNDAVRRVRPDAAAWGRFVEQHPESRALLKDALWAALEDATAQRVCLSPAPACRQWVGRWACAVLPVRE